jgi:hypothetical protein
MSGTFAYVAKSPSPACGRGRDPREAREGEGWRRLVALTKRLQNRQLHALDIGENFVVPEPKNTPATVFEPCGSFGVIGAIGMLTTIRFDHQSMLDASEIDDAGAKRVLTPKFELLQSPIAQRRPKAALGVGHVGSERAGNSFAEPSPSHCYATGPSLSRKRERGLARRAR